MTKEELKKVLEQHKHWIDEDYDGWDAMRAELWRADLRGADLRGTNLWYADLSGANLKGANLQGAYLKEADLSGANLQDAYLQGANLWYANLSDANLQGANLWCANFWCTTLKNADFKDANLKGANLQGADLSGAKNIPAFPYSCPDFGMFIGWKRASDKIVCLEIPEDARRLSATSRKCRCDKAKVLNITELDGSPCKLTEVKSDYNNNFIYKVGEMVSVPDFDENRWNECSTGIHFFINRMEAVNY